MKAALARDAVLTEGNPMTARRFDGTIEEMQSIIKDHNIEGTWSEKNGQHMFRTSNGATLSWWPMSAKKTVLFQGPDLLRMELEDKLGHIFTSGSNIPLW